VFSALEQERIVDVPNALTRSVLTVLISKRDKPGQQSLIMSRSILGVPPDGSGVQTCFWRKGAHLWRLSILLALGVLLTLLSGCGQDTASLFQPLPPVPTTPAQATAAAQAQATRVAQEQQDLTGRLIEPSVGGGLGDTRSTLDRIYGPPTSAVNIQLTYRNGEITAYFAGALDSPLSRVTNMTRSLSPQFGGPLSVAAAQALARMLMPHDAKLVHTYPPTGARLITTYTSTLLAQVIDPYFWTAMVNGQNITPGTFTVILTEQQSKVTSITLTIGNNPMPASPHAAAQG